MTEEVPLNYESAAPPIDTPQPTSKSLPEVHGSVPVSNRSTFVRRLLGFSGPAFMVSVGYMDPGNWATDLAAGSAYGYKLIWVILLSNLMAILLQALSARLGLVTGRDLAQACREQYPRPVVLVLWILCEIAIAACDLAEVLGSAIALHLLFGIPVLYGVLITAGDVMLFLLLQSYGIRKIEALILVLVATIGACFAVEMFISKPPIDAVMSGFTPSPLFGRELFIAISIIGATVMPHNLYLHSALVQSRAVDRTPEGIRQGNRFNLIDSIVALNAAFFVNAAILILAAAAFHTSGHQDVASLEDAHTLLQPTLGSFFAPILFAVALLAAGQSSTVTGTLAGQIVMEGFVHIRLRPWLRRMVTRALAIIPAVIVIVLSGERGLDDLLILSQVILSLQLSFAVVPLVHFTGDRRLMGQFVTSLPVRILAWLAAIVIMGLNLKLISDTVIEGIEHDNALVKYLLLPAAIALIPLLLWMVGEPFWSRLRVGGKEPLRTPELPSLESTIGGQYRQIAIALEATEYDEKILAGVIPLVRAAKAEVIVIHVVESATARFIGDGVDDSEARADTEYLRRVTEALRAAGVNCRMRIGAGEPEHEIARIATEEKVDLIVTGAHGHRLFGDLLHGSTASELRHRTRIPVLTVRT